MGTTAIPEKKEPQQFLQPSALQRGTEAARAAIAAGAQAATLEEPKIGERDTGDAGAEPPAKKVDGAEPATEVTEPGEGEAGAMGEDRGEGERETEVEGAADGDQPTGEGEGEPLVVSLGVVRDGNPPIELEVEDQEAADAIQSLVKGTMRRDQFNRAMEDVQQQREEMAQLEDMLAVDPVNFIVDRVRPDLQAKIALHLLAQPGVYDKVAENFINEDGSEKDREKVGLVLRNERLESRGSSQTEIEARSSARRHGAELANAVERIIPEDFSDEEAAGFRDDLLRDLRDHVERNNVKTLRPEELPHILERRLRQYGLDPESAVAAVSANAPATIRSRTPSRSAAGGPPEGAPARSTGQISKEGAEARRRAAAVPGAGAGAPPTRVTLPAGQKIEDRVKSLREMLGIRKR